MIEGGMIGTAEWRTCFATEGLEAQNKLHLTHQNQPYKIYQLFKYLRKTTQFNQLDLHEETSNYADLA